MRRVPTTALAGLTVALFGCNAGTLLSKRAEGLQAKVALIEGPAKRCAPRELAVAQTQLEFVQLELDQGAYSRAQLHLDEANEAWRVAEVAARFPDKPVVIGEIGWPSGGESVKGAAASPDAPAQVRDLVAQKIREFGETLHDKEKLIFDQRMIAEDPLTLQDIGEKYGISRERVRQIEERIKRRLRDFLVSEMPDINDVDVRLNLGTGN